MLQLSLETIIVDEWSRDLKKEKWGRTKEWQTKNPFSWQEDSLSCWKPTSYPVQINIKIQSTKEKNYTIIYSIKKLQHLLAYLNMKTTPNFTGPTLPALSLHLIANKYTQCGHLSSFIAFSRVFFEFFIETSIFKYVYTIFKNQTVNLPKSCFVFNISCDENVKN